MGAIDDFKWPGKSSAESKLNKLVAAANSFLTLRGDETFIRVEKRPGCTLVSLNWAAVLARMPRLGGVPGVPVQFISIIDTGPWYVGRIVTAAATNFTANPFANLTGCYLLNSPEFTHSDAATRPLDAAGCYGYGIQIGFHDGTGGGVKDTPMLLAMAFAYGQCSTNIAPAGSGSGSG